MVYRRRAKVFRKRRFPKRKFLKRIINAQIARRAENKRITYGLPAVFASVGNTWVEQDFCSSIAQNASSSGRIGREITVRSIELTGILAQGSTETAADDAWNVFRMVIGLYDGAGGATPLATASCLMDTPIKRTNLTRNFLIKKYYDKYFPLTVTSTEQGEGDGYTPGLRTVKYFKRFPGGLKIKWGDDSTTYPKTRLIVSCLSDSVAVVHPGFVAGYIYVSYDEN